MSLGVNDRQVMIEHIKHLIPDALEEVKKGENWRRWDYIAYPSGVKRSIALRDRYARNWRDNFTIHIREDGKLALVYHRPHIERSIVVRVTKPFRQRAVGISLAWCMKRLSTRTLAQVRYFLDVMTGDPYAAYSYPISAFPIPSSGRA